MPPIPPNPEYKNLRGLLVLCCAAGLVEINPLKGSWSINKKFADILYREMNKNLPPNTREAIQRIDAASKAMPAKIFDSYVPSDSPPEGMAGDSLGNPEE